MIDLTARIITVMSVLTLTAGPTMAENTATFVEVPIPAGTAIFDVIAGQLNTIGTLDGFRSYDLVLTTESTWTATALYISLSSGMIFQEPGGFPSNGVTYGHPSPAGFPIFPSSEFDTYIFSPHGGGSIVGGAGDVGGDALQFDTTEIDVTWAEIPRPTTGVGTYSIGRFTWSGDTNGTASVAFTTANLEELVLNEFQIVDGSLITIPEPASLNLLIIGGLGLLKRRYSV